MIARPKNMKSDYPVVSIGSEVEVAWPFRPRKASVGLVGLISESSSSLALGLEGSLARRDDRPLVICTKCQSMIRFADAQIATFDLPRIERHLSTQDYNQRQSLRFYVQR